MEGTDAFKASAALAEIRLWGQLIKFSHTVFALPFALSMLFVTDLFYPVHPFQIILIVVCLVSARTTAMAYNRLADAGLDARNPRTWNREIPAGKIKKGSVWLLMVLSAVAFLVGSAALGLHCLVLAPVVVFVLYFYSWTKRFTGFSHFILGFCLALAPGGVWYAVTAKLSSLPLPVMAGVMFWTAGFDIIYSCQDFEFDRRSGLRSLPVRLGIAKALTIAKLSHLAAVLFLVLFGITVGLGWIYLVGNLIFAAIIFSQHKLVSPHDLSRVDEAFFVRNGMASVVYLISTGLDVCFKPVLIHV